MREYSTKIRLYKNCILNNKYSEVFDNKNVKNSMKNSLYERKKGCCPPAPKKKKRPENRS